MGGGNPICLFVTEKIVKWAWAFMGIWIFWISEQDGDKNVASLIYKMKNTWTLVHNMTM